MNAGRVMFCTAGGRMRVTLQRQCRQALPIPYILVYKPTIFGQILTIKLWGSAYTWVMPYSHTLAARVSLAWTISRPLGLHVCVGACVAGGGTTQTAAAAAAYQLSQPL